MGTNNVRVGLYGRGARSVGRGTRTAPSARHDELTVLDAAVKAPRSELSSRHEPSMLDKLEGANLEKSVRRRSRSGVVVVAVGSASAMWRNGLRPADVIVAVERDRVHSIDELERALGKVSWGFVLEIARESERICIFVP